MIDIKVKTISLFVGVMTTFGCSIGTAQIIYSNAFNGGAVTIGGTAPTVANDLAGGISSARWIFTYTNGLDGGWLADGNIGTNAGSALLPFTPQPGAIYCLTASVTLPAANNWLGLGFAQSAIQGNNPTAERFTDPNVAGGPWMYAYVGKSVQFFGGPKTSLGTPTGVVEPTAGTYTLEIILNTVGVKWTAAAYVNGVLEGTNIVGGIQLGTNIVYGTNPNIGYVGLTQQAITTGGVDWNYLTLSVTRFPSATNNYWVAPVASGAGDGSSAANAASYLDSGFWKGVQSQLQAADVNVNLVNGTYNAGTLNLNDMGNPLHRLTLQAVNPGGAVFSTGGNTIIAVLGSQNIKFDGVLFTGPVQYWGVNCQPDYLKPCRNLEFSRCQFLNLTNVVYGAIGLVNGARDVLVDNCTFTNLTAHNGNHQHMIYASHDIVGVTVTNCLFQDCLADYVRFRDNSEYCTVENCQFVSTTSASAWPFISAELYNETNSDSAGDEFFGTHFQINGNSFTYNVSGGPGPYSVFHFSDNGYSPQSYDCDLTSAQAAQLANGTVSFQQSFLQTNMGIIASGIKMFGNTYNSRVAHVMDYTYNWDGIQPNGGWSGTVDLSGVPDSSGASLEPAPALRNSDFDRHGLLLTPASQGLKNWQCLFQTWLCSPKYTGILSHPGFEGTTNAMRFDASQNQYIYQWISHPTPNWTLDFLFAIGSGFTGSGTKFKVDLFHNDLTGSKVSIGVNSSGQFGIYNGGTFTVLPELGTVSFSTDNNGNGLFTDAGDTLKIYRLRIVGNYSASMPYVDIYTSDANSLTLNRQSLKKTLWVNGAPVSGQSAPGTVAFYNYTAPVVLDQISLAASSPPGSPVISGLALNNGNLIFTGINGSAGVSYYILSSTNLALPLANWTRETTNTFSGNSFSITNPILPDKAPRFYCLQLQP